MVIGDPVVGNVRLLYLSSTEHRRICIFMTTFVRLLIWGLATFKLEQEISTL
jgi:hypothetical protein